MFKKAQYKLFGIITAILLAIFVAVLGSVNLIMRAVMERQSKDVLKQIAAGVEYDDNTKTFTYAGPGGYDPRRNDDFGKNVPPPKPDENNVTSETQQPSTSSTTTVSTTTVTKTTASASSSTTSSTTTQEAATEAVEIITETEAPAPQTEEEQTEPQTEEKTQQPETQQQTTPPTESQTQQPSDTQPSDNNGNNDQQPPNEWWNNGWGGDPWNGQFPWGEWPKDENGQPIYPQWGWGMWPPNWGQWDPNWNWNWNGYGQQSPAPGENNGNEQRNDRGDHGEQNGQNNGGDKLRKTYASVDELYGSPVLLSDTSQQTPEEPPFDVKRGTEPVPKSLGSIDFFVVMADNAGKYVATLNNSDLSEEVAQQYITELLKKGAGSGMVNNYQFYMAEKDNGTLFVFTDKSGEINMRDKLLRTTLIIGAVTVVVLAAVAYFLSRQIMTPLRLAFEKQKQFISDASHELKTPLTVISANADVLSDEIGQNKWLDYIKSQTERMNVLVNDLLNLTRLENNSSDFIRTDFDISKAVVNTALPFECQAFESNKKFEVDVEEGLTVNGSERHIKQMAAIFIDNALKYSDAGGTVRVSLKKQGDKKVLSVYNTGKGVKDSEKERIFERFYRSDESRNRSTGGYGLGLAIAKSIIDKHKFKVHVDNIEGKSICFIVTM